MGEQDDFFGNGADQASLFGDSDDRMQVPERSYRPEPEKIRKRLNKLLSKAREADVMPWNERDARMWQTVFPNMANWLPDEEAEQLRLEFRNEMERLSDAA